MASEAVRAEAVVKRYGARTVVDGVSLSLNGGERLALLGHNGAGKTTILKMMLGLVRPSGGSLRVLGHDPAAMPAEVRRTMGFLPESVAFQESMSGREVLRFYARLKRRPAAECEPLLARVGLDGAAGRRIGTWSKGMRQRLGLAQALLGTPRLLLLDEPTSGLDPELRLSFWAILAEMTQAGAAVLLSSHLLTELEERTDRVAILDRGRLVAQGSLDELRAQAGLPVRITVRPGDGGAERIVARLRPLAAPARPADGRIVLGCAPADKLAVLRAIVDLGPIVRDVEIASPGLDEIYASFTGARPEKEV